MGGQQTTPRSGRGAAGASARAQYDARRQAGRGFRLALEASVAAAVGLAVGIMFGWITGLVAAVATALVVAVWLHRSQHATSAWRKGAKGERKTARMLTKLERRGWTMLHDRSIPGSKANIDHIAIGPGGVWVIDSKYWTSKHSRVHVHRGKLYYGRRRQDRVVDTAAWEARRVGEVLAQAGYEVPVQAALTLHGARPWFSVRFPNAYAMAAPRLPAFLQRRPETLSSGRVASLAAAAEDALPSYTAPAKTSSASSSRADPAAGSRTHGPRGTRQPAATEGAKPAPAAPVAVQSRGGPPARDRHGIPAEQLDALMDPRHSTLAGPSAADGVRIRADMLPSSTWGSNLRGVFPDDWNRLRKPVCAAAGNACELCGAVSTRTRRDGKPYRPDCHEKWNFALGPGGVLVQRLDRLVALCSDCHRVQHAGHANATGQTNLVLAQLRRVNDWSIGQARADVERAQHRWQVLNECTFDLDLAVLLGKVSLEGYPKLYIPARERDQLGNSYYETTN